MHTATPNPLIIRITDPRHPHWKQTSVRVRQVAGGAVEYRDYGVWSRLGPGQFEFIRTDQLPGHISDELAPPV